MKTFVEVPKETREVRLAIHCKDFEPDEIMNIQFLDLNLENKVGVTIVDSWFDGENWHEEMKTLLKEKMNTNGVIFKHDFGHFGHVDVGIFPDRNLVEIG